MAALVVSTPTFPDVPQAPGVPPVLRTVGEIQNDIVLVAADAVGIIHLFAAPQWGFFTTAGQPAFAAASSGIVSAVLQVLGAGGQSVGELEYRQDHRVATAPQEQGGFLSYNKVATPFGGRVTYIVGGTSAQRGAFLAAVKAMQASLTILNLVMPEFTYPSCNIVHHDLRRTAKNGISMFSVDIWAEEVRVTGTAAFSNTKQPSGADPVNGGTVQPQTPTAAQATVITT